MSATRSLILIRHGEVDFSEQAFRQTPRGRQWDPKLSAKGQEQAQLLGKRLAAHHQLGAVYVSPFQRCLETVAPFVELTGSKTTVQEDLGEVYVGDWEGKSFEEIVQADEQVAQKFRDSAVLFIHSGGESGQALRDRVRPAIDDMLDRHPEGDIAVIAHGGVINAYITRLLAFEHDMLYLPENTSLNTVLIDGADRRVKFLNDVRHLSMPSLFELDGAQPPTRA